jgi:predicted DNA-binding protein (MmcQ/YjbR family)
LQSCATKQRMDLEQFREYCLNKPHVTEGTPFGEDVLVFKVAGKMFALARLDQVPATANLKCDPDLALDLRDRYEQVRPGYHMNKKHWNTVEIDSQIPEAELQNDRSLLRPGGKEPAESGAREAVVEAAVTPI